MKLNNIDISEIVGIAQKAGEKILEVYGRNDFKINIKDDNSPLTIADQLSHQMILEELNKLDSNIPVISEEGKDIKFEERKDWEMFWLVDPLDGTKEFINRNGEFTVNIGLIENNLPVLGVIYVPVSGVIYYGTVGAGAWKRTRNEREKIKVKSKDFNDGLTVVQSRSHSGEEEEKYYSKFKIKETISRGSSLKICMLAEGKADLYFRGGKTWEWDTAAGHAILKAAGGNIFTKEKKELLYNKESLKNEGFIATSFELN
ncbi:MAG: 3'(2'),5'-bisphosphate nucleotidase CysQ [Ignavibacteria bacterium]|jgi:3'(2'), 5'-bisphosphate nucleotidase